MPTLFDVRKPPPLLASRRQAPKCRSAPDSTASSAGKWSKSADDVNTSTTPVDKQTSSPTSNIASSHDNPRTDHSYSSCSKSRPTCSSVHSDISSTTSSLSPRKRKLCNIVRRQRVQICRFLHQVIYMLQYLFVMLLYPSDELAVFVECCKV